MVDVVGELMAPFETEKAYHFSADGNETVWLPKSQCGWDEHTETMTMPEWLAIDKGLI